MQSPQTFPTARVSIFERLVPLTALAFMALGSGLTALFIRSAFARMRENEAVGIGTLAAAMTEATIPGLVVMYIGVVIGFIAIIVAIIRMFAAEKKSSPPFWFYIIPAFIAMIPAGLLGYVELLIFRVLDRSIKLSTPEILANHALLGNLLVVIMVASMVIAFIVFILSFIPFSVKLGRRIPTAIFVVLIELALVAVAIMFQINMYDLYKIAMTN